MISSVLFVFVLTEFFIDTQGMAAVPGVNHGKKRNEMIQIKVARNRFLCPGCEEKKELKELESLSEQVDRDQNVKPERKATSKLHCMKGDRGEKGEPGEKSESGKIDQAQLDAIVKPLEAKLEALKSSYTVEIARLKNEMHNLKSKFLHTLGSKSNPAISCKEIYQQDRYSPSGTYYLNVTAVKGGVAATYCSMDENIGCPAGSTLVMKIDGTKGTFRYSSPLWSNTDTYHDNDGTTIYDSKETKLPTYWSTPLTKVCISMRVESWDMDSLIIDHEASSFYDVISDDKYRPTKGNRKIWESLLPGSSLTEGCLKQGFNAHSDETESAGARIGAIAGADCSSLDSFIGLGTKTGSCDTDKVTSSGYYTGCHSDKHTPAFGYIFVY